MGKQLNSSDQIKGNGGFTADKIGEHGLGGPAAHLLTHQVNSDIMNGHLKKDAAPAQLYNLSTDRSQKINLYRENPEIVEQMKALLAKCLQSDRDTSDR